MHVVGADQEKLVQMFQNAASLNNSCIDPSGFVCNNNVLMDGNAQFNLIGEAITTPNDDNTL
jgi:hypothetical protein